MNTKFYTYNQNNSGGCYRVNDKVAHFVIIQAQSNNVADALAEDIGIYFDGCSTGDDCSCCGDRWTRSYREGTEQPEIYGKPALNFKDDFWAGDKVYIYYLDGKIDKYTIQRENHE